jgi:EpsD family peptidyl-prolyl cis-trans isomerase
MKGTRRGHRAVVLALSTGLMCALAACNKGSAPTTQLAAKLGPNEVTLYEVDRAVARLPAVAPADAARMRKRVLDELVDQRLMANEAVARKLDRTPDAVSDVEACKFSALQEAYLRSITAETSGDALSEQRDARSYYDQHPRLFSTRQVYRLREVAFPDNAGVEATQAETMPIADLTALLEAHDISYKSTFGAVPAEQLPPEVLDAMDSLQDGKRKVLKLSGNLLVLARVSASAAPMDEQAAEPSIIRYLEHVATDERFHAQIAALRSRTGVQYMNEFAEAKKAPTVQSERVGNGSETGVVVIQH